jgi:hypothetical protein
VQHDGEQLTDWSPRRARGIRIYIDKHSASLNLADRLYLEDQIASIGYRSSISLRARIAAAMRIGLFRLLSRLFGAIGLLSGRISA